MCVCNRVSKEINVSIEIMYCIWNIQHEGNFIKIKNNLS